MRHHRPLRQVVGPVVAILAASTLALAVPGAAARSAGPAAGSGDSPLEAPVVAALVEISSDGVAPSEVHLVAGGAVAWSNLDQRDHTVTPVDEVTGSPPACGVDGDGCVDPGATVVVVFSSPGTYRFTSLTPAEAERRAFTATVVVSAATTTEPTTTEPTTTAPSTTAPSTTEPSTTESTTPGDGPPPTTEVPSGGPSTTEEVPRASEPTTPTTAPPCPATDEAHEPAPGDHSGASTVPVTTTTVTTAPATSISISTSTSTSTTAAPCRPEPPATTTTTAPPCPPDPTTTTTTTAAQTSSTSATSTSTSVVDGAGREPEPSSGRACPAATTTTTTEATAGTTPDTTAVGPVTTAPPGDDPTPAERAPQPAVVDGAAGPHARTVLGGLDPAPATGGFPSALRILSDSVERSGPRTTARLVEAVAALEATGVEHDTAVRQVFGRFPVGGLAHYSHDWWFPRFGPGWRLHQGTDVFAAHGTPVRAPAAGVVTTADGGLGGVSVRITEPDGTYWYLAHLSAVAGGLATGAAVGVGDVVGYVGNTGNARTTPPHLHIERHPGGGPATDVKPFLDAFLDEAEAALPPAPPPAADPTPEPAAGEGAVPVISHQVGSRRLPGLVLPTGPTGRGTDDGRGWALTIGHPWMKAAWVQPAWPGGDGPGGASTDDPVLVAAGLIALGAVLGARRPRIRPDPTAGGEAPAAAGPHVLSARPARPAGR